MQRKTLKKCKNIGIACILIFWMVIIFSVALEGLFDLGYVSLLLSFFCIVVTLYIASLFIFHRSIKNDFNMILEKVKVK